MSYMGNAMRKFLFVALLTTIIVGGFTLAGTLHFGMVHAATEVTGIITSDTTWTKANSPYDLTGNVLVNTGVILTIEAGATINFNNHYMRVNGTLRVQEGVTINFASVVSGGNIQVNGLLVAVGSSANPIQMKYTGGGYPTYSGIIGSYITFAESSVNWNEQAQTGCIISNAIMTNAYLTVENTAKIEHNNIVGGITASGSTIITNNNITGSIKADGGVVISNNIITGANNVLFETIVIEIGSGSSPTDLSIVSNNVIDGGIPVVSGILRDGIKCRGYASITGNTIFGCADGIGVFPYNPISNFPLIEKNILVNNQVGISIMSTTSYGSNTPLVQQNLITDNTQGILVDRTFSTSNPVTPTIIDNSIYSNSHNMYLGVPYDIDATNNWWGTTDKSAIDNSIYDFYDDFDLGTVNFVPFLTEPNSEAPTKPMPTSTPPPTSSPSTSPTPSQEPQKTEQAMIIGVTIAVAVIGAGLGLLIYLIKRK